MNKTHKPGYNLFLDDFRNPSDAYYYTHNSIYNKLDWVVVVNYDEFVECIKNNPDVNIVSLDHDLADQHYDGNIPDYDNYTEKTGYDCAKWMCEFYLNYDVTKFPITYVHSMNNVGTGNIKQYINNFKNHFNI